MAPKLDNILLGLVGIMGTIRGIFIARVSRGRTIKEFILGVLFVPALVCFFFFVFGASAVYLQDKGIANIAKATETATFATLEHYPLGFILSIITLVVIMIFDFNTY